MTNHEWIKKADVGDLIIFLICETPFDYLTPDGYAFETFDKAVDHLFHWMKAEV